MVSDSDPLPQDARLGAILVRTAGLSLKTLQEALDRQRETGAQIGAILRDMKAISAGQLLRALELQSQLRQQATAK